MPNTGVVGFWAWAEAGYHMVNPMGNQTTWSLSRGQAFPDYPYKVTQVTARFHIRNGGYNTISFYANGETNLGSWYVNGASGEIWIADEFAGSLNYGFPNLTSISIRADKTERTELIGYGAGQPVFELYISWEETTSPCKAPTNVSVSETMTGNSNVTLSWSGASGGTNNAITGYEIQYQDSTDGSTWGDWSALTVIGSTETSGSTLVPVNAAPGQYRRYRIRVRGAAGADYYSGFVTTQTVQRFGKCSPPSSVSASTWRPALGETFFLNWDGASGGAGAGIIGYAIYYSLTRDGEYTQIGTVSTTKTSGSYEVNSPSGTAVSNYYKIVTLSAGGVEYNSDFSYVVWVQGGYYRVKAPTQLWAYPPVTAPGGMVTIRWNEGSSVTGNRVRGYRVYMSTSANGAYTSVGEVYAESDYMGVQRWVLTTPAPVVDGTTYYFKVKSIGTVSGFDSDLSTVTVSCTASSAVAAFKADGVVKMISAVL